MKKIIASALILALSVGAAQAQTTDKAKKRGHGKEHKMRGAGAFEKLNLSADQKTKLQQIREQHKAEMQALKSNQSLSAEQQKSQRMDLHKKYRAQYEAVLTPEQKAQAQKMLEERKSTGQFARGGGKGFGKGNFQSDLNLSADQQQKMTALRTEFRTKAESIRNNNSLSEDQKKTQMKQLRTSQKEQMKSILTQEQIQKLESKKKERSARNTR